MYRRLLVYFLLDCSESMIGEGIRAVEDGVNNFLHTLRKDPRCLDSVWVSIITFSGRAQQVVPLSELADICVPRLRVSPGTSLGAAFQILARNAHVFRAVFQTKAAPSARGAESRLAIPVAGVEVYMWGISLDAQYVVRHPLLT